MAQCRSTGGKGSKKRGRDSICISHLFSTLFHTPLPPVLTDFPLWRKFEKNGFTQIIQNDPRYESVAEASHTRTIHTYHCVLKSSITAVIPMESELRLSDGRREAALIKFRQKRESRRYDKRVRYFNRKKLADRRPRIRGQFASKGRKSIDVDLNGLPSSGEEDEYQDEEGDNKSRGFSS